jgi:putative ABC transport system substrate-binding protein
MVGLGFVFAAFVAHAQQPTKVHRIGYLGPGAKSVLPSALDAFRQELRRLGYVEGQNLTIEYRWAGGRDDRLPGLAAELVRLKVDAIVVEGHTPAIQAAKKVTETIPIVMGVSGDPVRTGLVASLARPGGNVTGLSIQTPELAPKRLELLKEAFPRLARLAVLWNVANPVKVLDWQETQAAAKALGLGLQSLEVRAPADFARVFDTAAKDRADALIVFADGLTNAHLRQILEFAATTRLPAMYPFREYVDAGGLLSYAPSYTDLFRRAAVYVDKILKGTKPADLPIESATTFEFAVNMKTAKALGLTIPPSLLMRADQVIE